MTRYGCPSCGGTLYRDSYPQYFHLQPDWKCLQCGRTANKAVVIDTPTSRETARLPVNRCYPTG